MMLTEEEHRRVLLENDRMREALKLCRDQFAFYANEHTKANKLEKAATNQRYARICAVALTGGITNG